MRLQEKITLKVVFDKNNLMYWKWQDLERVSCENEGGGGGRVDSIES